MLGRMASRMLTSLAVLCATLAWMGWVYLRTIGDPARAEDIATAVLEDDASREQISSSFALQIVRATGVDRSNIDLVERAVDTALDDPRISGDVIGAFGSAHANALGVPDARPTTIDTNTMIVAVREQVAAVDPELAAQIPDGSLPVVTLPKFHPPGVAGLRNAAESATTALALAALLLAAIALGFGERRRVLRRLGLWGVLSGVGWLLLPVLVVAGARAWASDADAIVEAAVRASVDGVMPVAIALVAGGAVALVLSFIPALWPATDMSSRRGTVVQRQLPHREFPHRVPTDVPGGYTAGHPAAHQPAHQAVPPTAAAGTTARNDTYVPSNAPARPPVTPHPPVASHAPVAPQAPAAPAPPPVATPQEEVDPWSTYFAPQRDD